MGTTKTIISVSSTVYNLAGDYNDKESYLIYLVYSAFLNDISVNESINNSIFSGPKMTYSLFLNWATGSDYKGNIDSEIDNRKRVDLNIVHNYLNTPVDQTASIQQAFIKFGDIDYFAAKYITENNLSLIDTNWGVTYLGNNEVEITYEDTTTEVFTLPVDFSFRDEYLYIDVKFYNNSFNESVIEGALINSNTLPDTSEFTELSNVVTPFSNDLNTTITEVRSFSNSDPDQTTITNETNTMVFNSHIIIKELETYLGNTAGEIIELETETYYEYLNYTIGLDTTTTVETVDHGTYTETITTTTETEVYENDYSYQTDSQITVLSSLNRCEYIIYKLGSGNVILDAMVGTSNQIVDDFYPIIPLRLYNESIRDREDWYEQSKIAYKKAINSDLDEILESIEDSPSIGDIDHAYIHFGFSLNTESNYEKQYIYLFFKEMLTYQLSTNTDYLDWLDDLLSNTAFVTEYVTWFAAQSDPNDILFDTPQPIFSGNLTKPPETTLRLRTDNFVNIANTSGTEDNFDVRLSWSNIREEFFTGVGKIGAKIGDYWITDEPPEIDTDELITFDNVIQSFSNLVSLGVFKQDNLNAINNSTIYIYKQITDNSYSVLFLTNLNHRNFIYGENYNVQIKAYDALQDEDLSGFIVPLSKVVLNNMSFLDASEILNRSSNIIFNSFTITKQKWYQSSIFKFVVIGILVIIAVIVTVISAGTAGTPAAAVVSAVATALAVSATTALIIGVILTLVVGFIAGMIINKILVTILEPIVGKRIATFLAAIGTIIITMGISSSFSGTEFFDVMSSAVNVIALTAVTITSAIELYFGLETDGLTKDINALTAESEKINTLIESSSDDLGLTNMFDLLNQIIIESNLKETPQEFLNRTLMTSDDIIETTIRSVTDFTEITLNIF